MGSTKTAHESRDEAIQAMGEDLGQIYHALSNELTLLYLKWNEYVVLYGTKPSRIDLMNRAAAGYFGLMEGIMWEDILIHIARLTDKHETRFRGEVKRNLTIRRLTYLLPDDSVLKSRLDLLIDTALLKSKFALDWRNRRIAHSDLDLAISMNAVPLKSSSRLAVKEALQAISDVLNTISDSYQNTTTGYEYMSNPSGAEHLLYLLDDGLKFDADRWERIRNGELQGGDRPRNL